MATTKQELQSEFILDVIAAHDKNEFKQSWSPEYAERVKEEVFQMSKDYVNAKEIGFTGAARQAHKAFLLRVLSDEQ